MSAVELILMLLCLAVALAIAADRVRLPFPIVLVIGGAALAFTPVPRLELDPDVVLVVFLPPLLFSAAWLMSWREFRANARTIGLLGIGLVVATTCGVAAVAHALIPDMPWGVAFVLGAIISPPDAVAATAVMQRLRVPPRLVVILEGESLVNDATGLVAYQLALAATVGHGFSAPHAASRFVVVGLAGVAFGLLVGWLVAKVHRRLDDFVVETAITLLTPYVAYIPAEHLGCSGVLAAVAAGGFLGWRNPRLFSPLTRLRSRSVWSAVMFLMSSLVFILMGLELSGTHRMFAAMSTSGLAWWSAAIAGTAILIRLVWVPIALHVPQWLRAREPAVSWKETTIVAWTAMRGIVSLALALALPDDLPYRDLLVLIVFVVIAVTLLGQGLTLPLLIRALGFPADAEGTERRQVQEALLKSTQTALERLDDTADRLGTPKRITEIIRTIYTRRCDRLSAGLEAQTEVEHRGGKDFRALRAELIEIERDAIVELRDRGVVTEDILQQLQQDLDLEALQPLR